LTIVEVVVGLSFLFFVVSVVASAINEAIAGVFNLRARMLEVGIVNLLTGKAGKRPKKPDGTPPPAVGGPDNTATSNTAEPGIPRTQEALVNELFDHSLLSSYSKDNKLPSYVASRTFRNALFDVTGLFAVTQPTSDPLQVEQVDRQVREQIAQLPSKHLRESLLTIWEGTNHNVTEFRAGVERWFDRAMERVGGWYKRRAQIFLFVIGLLLAFAVNTDAVRAAGHLWKDDGKRESIVAAVQNQQANQTPDQAIAKLDDIGFPIGWDEANRPSGGGEWAIAVLGWVITGIAVTLGAPFWFDVLNKVSNLRSAGRKPDSTLLPAPTKREVDEIKLTVSGASPTST
jgi:hypothetical protein